MNNSFDNVQSDSVNFAEAMAWEAVEIAERAMVEAAQKEEDTCRRCDQPEYRWGVCRDCWEACGE